MFALLALDMLFLVVIAINHGDDVRLILLWQRALIIKPERLLKVLRKARIELSL